MTAPAGWYEDTADPRVVRYWDGSQWTVHTSPNPAWFPPLAPKVIPPKRRGIGLGWGVLIGLVVLVLTSSLVRAVADPGRTSSDATPQRTGSPSVSAPAVTSAPTASPTPTATVPDAEPTPYTQDATVIRWIDGDTVDTTVGKVRVIGMDSPEVGQPCYVEAKANAERLSPAGTAVILTGVATKDTKDKYGRTLAYVDTVSTNEDVGFGQISAGLATARYDSRDGYGEHPRESSYVTTDQNVEDMTCAPQPAVTKAAPAPSPTKSVAPAPVAKPAPQPDEPWNRPGPDLDCADIGQKVWISGPDYHRLDADGDGWGCESYG